MNSPKKTQALAIPSSRALTAARRTNFAEQYRRQSRRVAAADRADTGLLHFLDDALADVDG